MLKKEHNDYLTRTDAGTPMGRLFRCYWLPALLASELPDDGCPPVRVGLLGEKLLAVRDGLGRYGLIQEFCAHRRVSLWFGITETDGIRCPYHGWKYDTDGQCTEIPSEPEDSELCQRIRLTAYPLIKVGDVLWTYMGPPDLQPSEPEWEFATVPSDQTYTSKRLQESNWLQAMEGGIDSSHVSWLHRGNLNSDPLFAGAHANSYNLSDSRPVFEVVETEGGLAIGAKRDAEKGAWYWRITPWVMPSFTMVPPRADHPLHGHFWIPIDDENCWAWSFDYHPTRPLSRGERAAMEAGKGVHVRCEPGTFRPLANKDNDYLIDREAQRAGRTSSGVDGIGMQDASLQESMGPIVDRSQEHLVSTDRGIVMARSRLLRAARALEQGVLPPGLTPAHQRVRSTALILPAGQPFDEPAKAAMEARGGKAHATV
ncbi:MAG TPA: Rieske 2Fe-2S domain-containing protein [Caulobacteraceae bacterium]|jgi:phenylpropionate dioxygenase-like ring-hydroxylating dioxygenase large terminal subunit|nr:Rieske 2Fe-2S domain-containing protein [Caulobacteraceae bacterium]